MNLIGETRLQILSVVLLPIAGAVIIGFQAYQDYALLYAHNTKPVEMVVSNYDISPAQPVSINDGYIYLMGQKQPEVAVVEEMMNWRMMLFWLQSLIKVL